MCQLFKNALAIGTALFFVTHSALAQLSPPPLPPGKWADIGLLGFDSVRDELKLTESQVTEIKTLLVELGPRPVTRAQEVAVVTKEERQKKAVEFNDRQSKTIEKAKALLTAEQAVRLRQIELWSDGPQAFTRSDVALELELTDDQKSALKTFADEFANKMAESNRERVKFSQIRPTDAEREEKFTKWKARRVELRAASEASCFGALTDEQKAKFEKMRGDAFELLKDIALPRRP
jgi:Spy/CpxP family protein refolding chaperone